MAGWYIRRGEKIVGPVDVAKLQELVATGRLLPTDHLSKDIAGPWQQASTTKLFAKPVDTQVAIKPSPIAPVANRPLAAIDEPPKINPALKATKVVGRGIAGSFGAVSRAMATRSQRKHEIKLAKIQAQTISYPKNAPVQRSSQPAPVVAQSITQATVVKIVNKNSSSGCSGCGAVLLLILIGAIAAVIIGSSSHYK